MYLFQSSSVGSRQGSNIRYKMGGIKKYRPENFPGLAPGIRGHISTERPEGVDEKLGHIPGIMGITRGGLLTKLVVVGCFNQPWSP